MDGGQVGVLEQAHQVGLSSLLQGQHCAALEAQVGLEVLGDLTHQALEGQLADQQLRALLVLADLTQSHGSRAVPAGKHTIMLVQRAQGQLPGLLQRGQFASQERLKKHPSPYTPTPVFGFALTELQSTKVKVEQWKHRRQLYTDFIEHRTNSSIDTSTVVTGLGKEEIHL